MRGSLAGLQQCSSRCQKEAKTVERLLKWRKVLMEDGDDRKEVQRVEEQRAEIVGGLKGSMFPPPTLACRKPKFGTTKRGGHYGPVEKANMQGILSGTLKISSYCP